MAQLAEIRTRQRGEPGFYQHLDYLKRSVASYQMLLPELTRTDVKTRAKVGSLLQM